MFNDERVASLPTSSPRRKPGSITNRWASSSMEQRIATACCKRSLRPHASRWTPAFAGVTAVRGPRRRATLSLWRVGYSRNTPRLIGSGVRESEARFTRDLTRTRIPRESGDPGAGHCTPAPRKGSAALPGPPPSRGKRRLRSGGFKFHPLIPGGASPHHPNRPGLRRGDGLPHH
jgi:hypothetical protein